MRKYSAAFLAGVALTIGIYELKPKHEGVVIRPAIFHKVETGLGTYLVEDGYEELLQYAHECALHANKARYKEDVILMADKNGDHKVTGLELAVLGHQLDNEVRRLSGLPPAQMPENVPLGFKITREK